ncbi:MAG: hypothetical protein HZC36_08175 [Armatimonadetes bacterium]|nr:hypothetical protein [Armatimonadota bacterium]
MLTSLAMIAVLSPFSSQMTMTLNFKPGDKLVYEISAKSPMMGLDAKGRMPLTVAKKDGAKITVSWPQVEMAAAKGTMQPIAAGSCIFTDKGRMVQPDPGGQGAMFLVPMALPEQPIAVGGTFKVTGIPGAGSSELTGKFEKLSEDGAAAVIVVDGLMSAQGGQIALHWESNFDLKRSIFRSGLMSMSSPKTKAVMSTFGFKLVE